MNAAFLSLGVATTSLAVGLWFFPIKRRFPKGTPVPTHPEQHAAPTAADTPPAEVKPCEDRTETERHCGSSICCLRPISRSNIRQGRHSLQEPSGAAEREWEVEFFESDWSKGPDMEVDTQPRARTKHHPQSTQGGPSQHQQRLHDKGDEGMMDAPSSGSSDTSDPDWGVDWGGTVSSLPRGSLRHLPSPRTEEWPSLEPHSLLASHRHTPSSGKGDDGVVRESQQPDGGVWPGVASTPPWPSALVDGATVASPFAAALEESYLRESVDEMKLGPVAEGRGTGAVLVLSVMEGPVAGRVFRWDAQERRDGVTGDDVARASVGRHPNNALVLEDDEVSSYHAELKWEKVTGWTVRDRGSLNGTQLNGVVISEPSRARGPKVALGHGDVLQLGTRSRLRVTFQSSSPPSAPVSSSHGGHALASLGGCSRSGLTGWKGQSACGAADVCASPPRPIRTRSQKDREEREVAKAAAAATSPVGVPEERRAEWVALGVSAAVTSVVGRQHRLKGQPSEDKAGWAVPLPLPGAPSPSPRCGDEGWCALFGIYDGHGGVRAAEEAHRRLPDEVGTRLGALLASGATLHPKMDDTAGEGCQAVGCGSPATALALSSAFLALDATLGCDEGCTATTVLLWHARLGGGCDGDGDGGVYVQAANVGDSSALFVPLPSTAAAYTRSAAVPRLHCVANDGCQSAPADTFVLTSEAVEQWVAACGRDEARSGGSGAHWVCLTTDHRLVNPDEQRRLADIGVQVSRGRLYGLNLGRSLGDKCLKDADLGLLATPSVSRLVHVPPGCMGLVIIASDGLWDSISPEDATDIALRVANGGHLPGVQDDGNSGIPVPTRIARALLEVADRHKRTDDITVMVLAIDGAAR